MIWQILVLLAVAAKSFTATADEDWGSWGSGSECRLYLGTATVVDVLRCWLMIALAAAAAAATLCSSFLPALPCMLHFLLPQDAATKTASKLLKLQQI